MIISIERYREMLNSLKSEGIEHNKAKKALDLVFMPEMETEIKNIINELESKMMKGAQVEMAAEWLRQRYNLMGDRFVR